jgi:N-acylneuraminate cytidylyltransferase/CMP-N,N'-diacetyllegionaminic acid synthase
MKEVLAIIPARSGSKRIPGKNIKNFLGKPLIVYTIEQTLKSEVADRVIVDTDSQEIADIASEYGAEVLFLRPEHLAYDSAQVVDSILHTLEKLKEKDGYEPTHIMILQTTSPLRELEDIDKCWDMMQNTDATTVLTICETHPRLYHLSQDNDIVLVNGSEKQSTNMQAWEKGYILNGCFVYIIDINALKTEKLVITKKTKAVVCEKWRSVDLDNPEDWVLAEFLHKNKQEIKSKIQDLNNQNCDR